MKQLFSLVLELGKIRKIPQFLFFATINPVNMVKVKERIVEYKRKTKNDPVEEIDLIINSGGGSADDAYRILRTLRKNFTTVNVVVPFWAKSAATLLSLGGSCIIMDEFAEFGPLDVQLPKERDDNLFLDPDDSESALIDEISLETIEKRAHKLFLSMFVSIYTNKYIPINKNDLANDIMTYLSKFYEPIVKQINPYKIGDKKRKNDIGTKYAGRILEQYNPQLSEYEIEAFIDFLVNDCPDHGYVVDFDLSKKQLPEIKLLTSKELDGEFPGYSDALTDITIYLLKADHQRENYVGFIEEVADEDLSESALSELNPQSNVQPTKQNKNGKSKKADANK